ncbi:serine/threonine-protein kinase [Paraburkholderia aromaticivorans]|uniref:serine/threonine-protein kinase n=1 Tax=Paraburkholderia aromaticivorans TaxID=2026199 RepID=UPI001455EC02|nr:serine/threonine-protein kinase [Paraburkholderia aromaticivorans]
MDAALIKSLGKYQIETTLGVGAMGVVYRAFDPHIERRVALKTIRNELFDSGERASLMARFRNEAQAAGRLSQPNIVAVYDYGEADGTAYIAMEYVDGRGLNALLDAGEALDLHNALDWFTHLLAALAYAHEHGVVHRDIKPANLLVTARGQLKVTDFGIAHIESSTLTVVGSMVGTPSYMAPEQFCGDSVDGRSDLYSAAVVLYQMLTGQRPFAGAPASVMQQVLRDTPLPPTQRNPALPAALDAVLMRALAKDRAVRYQTPAELRAAVFEAINGVSSYSAWADDDRTVLTAPDAGETASLALAAPSAPAAGEINPTVWPVGDLAAVEARLAAQVGPVARLLVARAATRAADLPTLRALLVPHIPSDKGRQQFTDGLSTLAEATARGTLRTDTSQRTLQPQSAQRDGTSMSASTSATTPTPEQIRAAALQLAVYLGPIAHLIAKREAPRALDLRMLQQRLASAISNDHDRASFLRATGLRTD